MTHKTIEVTIDGEVVNIDEDIKYLILAMNDVGIKTLYSCQGDRNHSAYVTINMGNIVYYIHDLKSRTLTIRWKHDEHLYIPKSSIITLQHQVIDIEDLDDNIMEEQ